MLEKRFVCKGLRHAEAPWKHDFGEKRCWKDDLCKIDLEKTILQNDYGKKDFENNWEHRFGKPTLKNDFGDKKTFLKEREKIDLEKRYRVTISKNGFPFCAAVFVKRVRLKKLLRQPKQQENSCSR